MQRYDYTNVELSLRNAFDNMTLYAMNGVIIQNTVF
jgi:hypothetical protein